MKKGNKKKKVKKILKKFINVILISVISISFWEIGKKEYAYYNNYRVYNQAQREKDDSDGIFEYLEDKDFDWITVSDTAIDYPLVQSEDNEYYLTHDYLGNFDIAGSIWYDASDEPYNGLLTVIYGHSMRSGSMFNNLHYFQKDHKRFKDSMLTIYSKDGNFTNYKSLGYMVYTGEDTDYRKIDDMSTEDAIEYLEEECDFYINDIEYSEDSHIIALVTCDYSVSNGRLAVFYISE